MKDLTQQYYRLVKDVLKYGTPVLGRNGYTHELWAPQPLVHNFDDGFPILYNRPVAFYKSALETLFFLSGNTSYESMSEDLRNSWWKPWAEQAKAEGRWKGFYGAMLRGTEPEPGSKGFDQLSDILSKAEKVVRSGVGNRKMVISLWNQHLNPVLEACHSTSLVFNLRNTANGWRLDLHHTQRSLDVINGCGPDLVYSGLLMELIADYLTGQTNSAVKPGKLIFAPVNVHVYENHFENARLMFSKRDLKAQEQNSNLRLNKPDILKSVMSGYNPQTISEVKELFTILGYEPELCTLKFLLNG